MKNIFHYRNILHIETNFTGLFFQKICRRKTAVWLYNRLLNNGAKLSILLIKLVPNSGTIGTELLTSVGCVRKKMNKK